ncbi:MAG: ABC-type antimicrobial peptide transport system permease subunit [Roseivirga sp.]|jgi:putative ABC transport system permease protein
MFKNYIITAYRNLVRNRVYTFINVFGLALGISAAIVLFKIVLYEKSFDQYQTNFEDLYRITKRTESVNQVETEAGIQNPFTLAFKTDYPDYGLPLRVFGIGESQLSVTNSIGDLQHFEQRKGIAFADKDYFKLFDYDFELGNSETALEKPNAVVISVSLVEKLFGITDGGYDRVIGKQIRLNDDLDVFVTAVVKDPPVNSSVPFIMLMEYESISAIFDFYQPDSWTSTSSNANVFFLKAPGVQESQLETALDEIRKKYKSDDTNNTTYGIQAMADIHFQPEYNTYEDAAVSNDFLTIPIAIGVFLILTACINFVNLSTALAIKRSKEVGIRKVLGGRKGQLMQQFLGETFFITIISVLISLGAAELIMTNMEQFVGYNLSLNLLKDPLLILILLGITLGVTLLAGLYPSVILSKLAPVKALKSKGQTTLSGSVNTRRGLVVFQFIISQLLVVCTLVVIAQMEFFEKKDLGFRKSSIVIFPLPSNEEEKLNPLRNELSTFAGIEKVSFNFSSPLSDNNISSDFGYAPLEMEGDYDAPYKVADEHYLDLYGIEILAGRNFTSNDTLNVAIISKSAMRLMEIENPLDAIGKQIKSGFDGSKTVIGVINDFHTKSLKVKLEPVILVTGQDYYYEGAIRFVGTDKQMGSVITALEKAWTKQYPNVLFDYSLFSESIMDGYSEEANMMTLFQIFSGIAILIGCLGLYGLVAFLAGQKTKEIGVRKVLGASVGQILNIFSKELLILIVIAFSVAAPIAYFIMNGWLADFEYRVNINVWVFVIAIGFTLLVAGLTTGFRSVRAAQANPVDSLRSE